MQRFLLVGCCAAANLAAQQVVRTAHPQDSLTSVAGSLVPLGVFPTGLGAEARAQILVRAEELPGPGALLTGIEVHCASAATVVYQSLTLTVSPTAATQLSNAFASNLPQPVVMLQQNQLTVVYGSTDWTAIQLSGVYVHDGQSALALEFRKIVDVTAPMLATMDLPSASRPDRPAMIHALGGPGSGASVATSATSVGDPIAFRLVWSGAPTMRHRSDIQRSGNPYAIGSNVLLTVEGAPGAFFLTGVDLAFRGTPVVVPGVRGRLRIGGAVFGSGLLDGAGVGVQALMIPNDPVLVGMHVVYQGGVMDPVTGVGQLTNGHDHFVNQ